MVGHDEVGVDDEAHAEPGADAARSVGLLNEKVRGSISAKLMPQCEHANCSEYTCSAPVSASTVSMRPSP